ncbi:Dysferlin [Trifolium repens]|nr:Dysferlin [Trifolium repens]
MCSCKGQGVKGLNLRVLYSVVRLIAIPRYICNRKARVGHQGTTMKCSNNKQETFEIATMVTLQGEDQPFILHLITSKSKSGQNIRGGRVVLYPIVSPPFEFDHVEKGDALYEYSWWKSGAVPYSESSLRI